jgi:hypothetical protein
MLEGASCGAVKFGERFDAVPEDYLRWIIEGQNELREEVRASARYWLDRRGSNGPPLPGF